MISRAASMLLAIVLMGCNGRDPLPDESASAMQLLPEFQGKACTVIYRRDALGYATADESGVSAETIESGNRKLAATGKMRRAEEGWVLLESGDGRLIAIPVGNILSVYEAEQVDATRRR